MIRAGRQLGEVQTRKVKQGAINIPLGGLHPRAVAADMLPPRVQRGLAFSRGAICFIRDNNVSRGELIAEILIGHRLVIQKLTRIEQAQGGAQVDPRLVNRGGQ